MPGGQKTDLWIEFERNSGTSPLARILYSENAEDFKKKLELLVYNPAALMPPRHIRQAMVELKMPHYEKLKMSKLVQSTIDCTLQNSGNITVYGPNMISYHVPQAIKIN